MKTKLVNSDLNDKFPVALLDENDLVVARFKSETQARDWATRNHYQIVEE